MAPFNDAQDRQVVPHATPWNRKPQGSTVRGFGLVSTGLAGLSAALLPAALRAGDVTTYSFVRTDSTGGHQHGYPQSGVLLGAGGVLFCTTMWGCIFARNGVQGAEVAIG
jgi:hypothetical protein